jgi:hypothetical protein
LAAAKAEPEPPVAAMYAAFDGIPGRNIRIHTDYMPEHKMFLSADSHLL